MKKDQFSLRIEPELIRRVDTEAKKEYKTRTEIIKEAILKLLEEKYNKESLKKVAAELWLKGELSENKIKRVLSETEIRDLKFGKTWIEETLNEFSH